MDDAVRALYEMAERRAAARALTFGAPHVFKAVRMLGGPRRRHVGRAEFSRELRLGAGSVRTLVSRLRGSGAAESVRAGTRLTALGERLASALDRAVPEGCGLPGPPALQLPPPPSAASPARGPGRAPAPAAGHAVLLRGGARDVGSGMEQRDYAVEYGADGALTLVCAGGRLVFPRASAPAAAPAPAAPDPDPAASPPRWLGRAAARLGPAADGDAVIVAVSGDALAAELAALNAALRTMAAGSGYACTGSPRPP